MKIIILFALILLTLLNPLLAGVTPEEQEQAFQQLAQKSYLALNHKDEEGNILWVCFNQMNPFKKKNPEATGLHDEDMALLRKFPHLRGITLQGQPLTNAGFQVLAEFPQLEVASLSNPATHPEHKAGTLEQPTAEYIMPLDNCRNLVVLDLTHTFRISGSALPRLQGFPKLKFLSVDVGASGPDLLEFLDKCPEIEVLRLHRTPMSDSELQGVLQRLPKLRYLMIKRAGNPEEPITAHSLRHFQGHPSIEAIRFSHNPPELTWEDGLEHLVEVKTLKQLLFKEETPVEPGAVEKLQAARPDLLISTEYSLPKVIDAYPWWTGPR